MSLHLHYSPGARRGVEITPAGRPVGQVITGGHVVGGTVKHDQGSPRPDVLLVVDSAQTARQLVKLFADVAEELAVLERLRPEHLDDIEAGR